MKKKAHELIFISQIKRDGSGVYPIDNEEKIKDMEHNQFIRNEEFNITCLSITEKTFIANGFNSYVVRLK